MAIEAFSPRLEKEEVFQVLQTLQDNWLTEGKKTQELESRLAEYFGCKRVLMVPNGTLAIFAALKVFGIGPGHEVLVPDFTFFGTASAVLLAGATPVLVDVDEFDFHIDVSVAESSLSEKTRAIIPVHIYGQACDMMSVMTLAKRHKLIVIEDAAQGMGVTFGQQHVGTFGDIGCISFFADKTMTTGEGGALLINDEPLAEECIYFKNQGRLHRGTFMHERVGYNFRITDLQAAIGLAQFGRLAQTMERKRAIRAAYYQRLRNCPELRIPVDNGFGEMVPFRVNVLVNDPEGLADCLKQHGISTRRFFYPLHLQPSLTAQNSIVRVTPVISPRLFEQGLMLPSGLNITDEQIDDVCGRILEYQHGRAERASAARNPGGLPSPAVGRAGLKNAMGHREWL